ncbi:hypothetical protein DERF_006978 [Dermatophagoides farinae]|uniref:Uncharacterized protein n=1 Tax=Dermatophagoides farinae TaxID=6954 RepID=A0A922L5J7_DERFA|nr:hypothetical protein DERF_006978 [Dermatophagoides farinae]
MLKSFQTEINETIIQISSRVPDNGGEGGFSIVITNHEKPEAFFLIDLRRSKECFRWKKIIISSGFRFSSIRDRHLWSSISTRC